MDSLRPLSIVAFALTVCLAATSGPRALVAGTPDVRPETIAALLAKVIPAVVAIHATRVLPPDSDDPAAKGSPRIERAEGSGFIASPDGFIATNKHVVHGAYYIAVTLHDGRTREARIVWESPVVDVAFVKVEAYHPMQAVTLARDEKLDIGRHVVAIGNPQGLGISASAGIVSALDRNLKQSPYDSFIQTDAAINAGNSGGPLFDLDGEVVGMNSIYWTAGKGQGSQGLGFAIPASDIAFLIDQLKRNGRIECGTLGVHGQKLTAAVAEALSFPGQDGVVVATIEAGSTAAQAGLRPGDIVTRFDGKTLSDVTTLNRAACRALGRTVAMEVWHDGHTAPSNVRLKEMDDGALAAGGGAPKIAAPRFAGAADLGLRLAPVDDPTRQRFHLGADVSGLVVTDVADSGEAEVAGLSAGDLITSLQMSPLSGAKSFDEAPRRFGRTGHSHVVAFVRTKGGERLVALPVRLEATP